MRDWTGKGYVINVRQYRQCSMKNIILSVLFSFCFLPLWGQKDFSQIDSLIKQLLPESSEVGISVYDLTAKKPLYDYRAEKLSRPASTMKLLTALLQQIN